MNSKGVAHVIATVPKALKLSPLRAEVIGADYLFTILPQVEKYDSDWARRLQRYAADSQLVLRPIHIEFSEYSEHLARIRDWDGNEIDSEIVSVFRKLPNWKTWMIELSVPELFPRNKRKVGEVLIRSDLEASTKRDFGAFLFARLPGCFAFYSGGGPSNPKYAFIRTRTGGHVELYGCEE